MKKQKLYFANQEKLNEICRELRIVKSKFDAAMTGMQIKGLASKYFSLMSLGKKSFQKEIYDQLARNFTKLYRDVKIDKEVAADELYIDEQKSNEETNKKIAYLEKYTEYGMNSIGFAIGDKIILNRVRVDEKVASLIEKFIFSLDSTMKRQDKFSDRFYSAEEQLEEIKDEAKVNSLIDDLAAYGVNIYTGHIRFPLISYRYDLKSREDNLYEIRSFPWENIYFAVLFASKYENVDYFKFEYEYTCDYKTLLELEKKFPIKFDYINKHLNEEIAETIPNNKPHNEILNNLAEKYLELEFNPDFEKIVSDVVSLPFSFTTYQKIIPVKKNKISDEEKKLKEKEKEKEREKI